MKELASQISNGIVNAVGRIIAYLLAIFLGLTMLVIIMEVLAALFY